MDGSSILVTGITGFVGSYLASYLEQHYPNCQITGLARASVNSKAYTFRSIDLNNSEAIVNFLNETKPNYIFHLAGTIFTYDWQELQEGNIRTTINLFEAIKKLKLATKVIMVGSAAEYGIVAPEHLPVTERYLSRPYTPYGLIKLWQTNLCQLYAAQGLDVVVGRLFNVIGKNSSTRLMTGNILNQIKNIMHGLQEPIIQVGNIKIKRDFIDIYDACKGFIALAKQGESGEIYNICSGSSYSFEKILHAAIIAAGITVELKADTTILQNNYIDDIYGDNTKILQHTDWKSFIPLAESLEHVFDTKVEMVS